MCFLWCCVADPRQPGVEGGNGPAPSDTKNLTYGSCEANVQDHFTVEALAMPDAGSDGWVPLDIVGRAALQDSVTAAVSEDVDAAIARAADADYALCVDGDRLVWSPRSAVGRAVAALDLDGAPVQLEVPHPVYDTDTLAEGVVALDHLRARVLLTSGTHRCASLAAVPCSGTSAVCTGSTEAYRASDPAHAVDTSFHALHIAFSSAFANDLVVSMHGMSDDGASLSDGTEAAVGADSPVATLAAALAHGFPGAPITTCNAYPDAVIAARLCGTTNVQGRHLNGSADPCTEKAEFGAGRFIHLEQSRSLRGEPLAVATALADLLP